MFFTRRCAIPHCAEKQGEGERGRAERGERMSAQEMRQTEEMEGGERGSVQTQKSPTLVLLTVAMK